MAKEILYEIRDSWEGGFDIVRDGEKLTSCGGTREFAEEVRDEYFNDELASREALKSGDPKALCALGWHRQDFDSPPSEDGSVKTWSSYFRFAAKIKYLGGSLIFRTAPIPFLWAARTTKALGSTKPWACSECGALIPEPGTETEE